MHESLSRRGFVGSGLAAVASSAAVAAALAPGRRAEAQAEAIDLRVSYAFGASNLPIWVGLANGFFRREKVNLVPIPRPEAASELAGLRAGDVEVALAPMDDVIAADAASQAQGASSVPPEFVACMGGDDGLLHVIARPEITAYSGFRGKTIAVDGLTTGQAFVVRRLLALNDLPPDAYRLAPVGGSPQRLAALTGNGPVAGALLGPPFDLDARSRRLTDLGSAASVIGPYQGLVGVVRRGWMTQNLETLTRFIRGYVTSLRWVYDPAHHDDALVIIEQNTGLGPSGASQIYDALINPVSGLAPDAKIDIDGVKTALSLRRAYGGAKQPVDDPNAYIDLTAYRRAVGASRG